MSARQVQRDFSENHARALSRDYIQNLGQEVGLKIEKNEERVNYTLGCDREVMYEKMCILEIKKLERSKKTKSE